MRLQILVAISVSVFFCTCLFAQTNTQKSAISVANVTIAPYLQNLEPHSAYIRWETDSGEESIVEWGLSESLENQTEGISFATNGGTEILHEVHLENLDRFTTYFYRVQTDNYISDIFQFKTPPFASDNETFRIVAMSDMQRDGSFPDKYREIVEDGVLDYWAEEYEGDLVDNLAMVMIPGDLVVNGNNFTSWKNAFFNPAEKLLSQVPLYPAPGNHENDSPFYFTYFNLPLNGTAGFEEHWYYKDYSNLRLISMDSNAPYNGQEQLDWLQAILESTCSADSIDFVFVQLHHPHKSELWTPGESNFTGDVISQMEQFSTTCNKPSIHFFGHTHGYSRGQSRDHKHLWINVATAGGAIDNWGEFPNFDYDEFSVSQDEYGFVVLEVSSGDNPTVGIKRISRGDQDLILDNIETDRLFMSKIALSVETPQAIYPVGDSLAPECVILQASQFDGENDQSLHGQSHWQVDLASQSFEEPIAESWKNYENWYFDIDTQADDLLTDEKIEDLSDMTAYQWRVRFRDREMNWSSWSAPALFTTTVALGPDNLLANPGSEDMLESWTTVEGVVESVESNLCDGIPSRSGLRHFAIGGICEHSEVGIATQHVDVNSFSDSIDLGNYKVNFGGYLSNFSGSDQPEMKVYFLDTDGTILQETAYVGTLSSNWTKISEQEIIPPLTRSIKLELKGTRNAGTDNDSYFDDLFLTVGTPADCQDVATSINVSPAPENLTIYPNPASNEVRISIPSEFPKVVSLYFSDQSGKKVFPRFERIDGIYFVDTTNLAPGMYFTQIRSKYGTMAVGKMIISK